MRRCHCAACRARDDARFWRIVDAEWTDDQRYNLRAIAAAENVRLRRAIGAYSMLTERTTKEG